MLTREELELQHERTVREEIEIFRDRAQKVLAGEISDDEFRPFRLKHGIYGQRQPGVQMVRTKVPGGLLTARQMEQLGLIRRHRQSLAAHKLDFWEITAQGREALDVFSTDRKTPSSDRPAATSPQDRKSA